MAGEVCAKGTCTARWKTSPPRDGGSPTDAGSPKDSPPAKDQQGPPDLAPRRKLHEACSTADPCESGLVCLAAGPAGNVCLQSCGGNGDCSANKDGRTSCGPITPTGEKVCHVPGAVGDPCNPARSTSCASGLKCLGGACVKPCKEGAKKCEDKTALACVAGAWKEKTVCGQDYECLYGECVGKEKECECRCKCTRCSMTSKYKCKAGEKCKTCAESCRDGCSAPMLNCGRYSHVISGNC